MYRVYFLVYQHILASVGEMFSCLSLSIITIYQSNSLLFGENCMDNLLSFRKMKIKIILDTYWVILQVQQTI